MTLAWYLVGAWLTTCVMHADPAKRQDVYPAARFVAAVLLSAAWPVVWVVVLGGMIRGRVLRA